MLSRISELARPHHPFGVGDAGAEASGTAGAAGGYAACQAFGAETGGITTALAESGVCSAVGYYVGAKAYQALSSFASGAESFVSGLFGGNASSDCGVPCQIIDPETTALLLPKDVLTSLVPVWSQVPPFAVQAVMQDPTSERTVQSFLYLQAATALYVDAPPIEEAAKMAGAANMQAAADQIDAMLVGPDAKAWLDTADPTWRAGSARNALVSAVIAAGPYVPASKRGDGRFVLEHTGANAKAIVAGFHGGGGSSGGTKAGKASGGTKAGKASGGTSLALTLLGAVAAVGAAAWALSAGGFLANPDAPRRVNAENAVDIMRLYLGSVDYATVRAQQRFYERTRREVASLAKKTGQDEASVWEQIENEARRRGIVRPRPGKDLLPRDRDAPLVPRALVERKRHAGARGVVVGLGRVDRPERCKPPGCCPSARPLPGGGVLLTEEKDGRLHEIELTPEAVRAIDLLAKM
jgi:hypothetical protein